MKHTPMRLHPADIKHRHRQPNITNTNHPIPYLECQPPTVSLVPRPVAAPTTVTAYTSTTIHYHQHEACARARASTPAHVLVPVPTSSALRQYRHRQLSRHRYQLQSTSTSIAIAAAQLHNRSRSISSISSRYHIHHNSHHCIDRSLPQYIKSSASDMTTSIAISRSAIQPVGQPDSHSHRRTDQQSAIHSFTQTD